MNEDIDTRVLRLAEYILNNQTTIRATAQAFNIPKSTVHHDLSTKLKYLNYHLFLQVKHLLDENFSVKHIHGGESTKHKYEQLKQMIDTNDQVEFGL